MDSLSVFKRTYCWNTFVGVPPSEVLGQILNPFRDCLKPRNVKTF
ncbi:hypothetical protein LEP1GSC133_5197 [Leptospira borgpetersenii serovar Pomona str. 200901868]|uniref:Uncharacterized protein n=1 Tax=Leptospira borgpetersenii serovar Pomona str. 200901868 TaxID=1192866 RepID=M6WGM9_LEPBO|nr:hypothetical protein LEP1GSC133_5197 [Leptospira borgpetersenii serovar Pomona str. 200901868]